MPLTALERKVLKDLRAKATQNGAPEFVCVEYNNQEVRVEMLDMDCASRRAKTNLYKRSRVHWLKVDHIELDGWAWRASIAAVVSKTPVTKEDATILMQDWLKKADRVNVINAARNLERHVQEVHEAVSRVLSMAFELRATTNGRLFSISDAYRKYNMLRKMPFPSDVAQAGQPMFSGIPTIESGAFAVLGDPPKQQNEL